MQTHVVDVIAISWWDTSHYANFPSVLVESGMPTNPSHNETIRIVCAAQACIIK